jgi:hypothetical protein
VFSRGFTAESRRVAPLAEDPSSPRATTRAIGPAESAAIEGRMLEAREKGSSAHGPEIRIGSIELEVRMPPQPSPPEPLRAADTPPRFSLQRHYLRWS